MTAELLSPKRMAGGRLLAPVQVVNAIGVKTEATELLECDASGIRELVKLPIRSGRKR